MEKIVKDNKTYFICGSKKDEQFGFPKIEENKNYKCIKCGSFCVSIPLYTMSLLKCCPSCHALIDFSKNRILLKKHIIPLLDNNYYDILKEELQLIGDTEEEMVSFLRDCAERNKTAKGIGDMYIVDLDLFFGDK